MLKHGPMSSLVLFLPLDIFNKIGGRVCLGPTFLGRLRYSYTSDMVLDDEICDPAAIYSFKRHLAVPRSDCRTREASPKSL